MKKEIIINIFGLLIFALLFAPICVALFAKAFGHPNTLIELIKEAYMIELKLFRIIK